MTAQEIALSIIAEIAPDELLTSCRTFADLHQHCDANVLGQQPEFLDACGWADTNTDAQNEAALVKATDVLNSAQDIVSRWLQARIEGRCLVLDPTQWHADDGNAEMVYECESGQEAAQEYVDGGEWDRTATSWITVQVWREGINQDGEIVRIDEESHKITLEAEEPPCCRSTGHKWQSPHRIVGGIKENPGVVAHGGGAIIQEVCTRCGCGKTTDTWAQDPSTGEQGLRSVEYEPGKYSDQISAGDRSGHLCR